jgi:RecA/RadA recombinase
MGIVPGMASDEPLVIDKDLIKEFGEAAFISGDTLSQYSNEIVHVSPRIDLLLGGGIPGGSVVTLAGDPKCGKDQPLNAIVWTPDGPLTMGDMRVGQRVCTDTGLATVIDVFPQGTRPVYEIEFVDGDTCQCGIDHLWEVQAQQRNSKELLTTKQLIESGLTYSDRPKWSVRLPSPLHFIRRDISIHPYLLGCLLGDGGISQSQLTFTNVDQELIEKIVGLLPHGYELIPVTHKDYRIKSNGPNILKANLEYYQLHEHTSHTKFIPDDYKFNDIDTRWKILQGLMDTDGSISKRGWCEFTTVSPRLADDVKFLVQSLGGICKVKQRTTTCQGKRYLSYRCSIRMNDTRNLFQLSRKKMRASVRTKGSLCRWIKDIRYVHNVKTQCIKLDNERGLYLTNNCIVTHNTVTALHILGKAQQAGRKTFFLNVEGRIKPRDLVGIACLDASKLQIVRSYRDEDGKSRILKAHEFLAIAENIIHNHPGAVVVIDSVSQLVTSGEMENELNKQDRAPGATLMAKFCRRLSNVIPVNDIILIGVLHFVANTSGYGKAKFASGGNKIKYAMDVGLECKKFSIVREGGAEEGQPIGQEVDWITTSTAFAPPGQRATSMITFGIGIDELYEMVEMGIEFGFITQSGSWLKMTYMQDVVDEKTWGKGKDAGKKFNVQGKQNLVSRLRENDDERIHLEKAFHEMMGVDE